MRVYTTSQITLLDDAILVERMENIESAYASPVDCPKDLLTEYAEIWNEVIRRKELNKIGHT